MKKLLKLATLFLCGLLLCGCSSKQTAAEKERKTDFVLNTVCTITLYDGSDPALLEEAFALLREKEAMFSRTVAAGEIGRLNAAGGEAVAVSEETLMLLEAAQNYYALSEGLFDVTVAPVTDLWDFTAENPALPEGEALAEALTHVGMENLVLTEGHAQLLDPKAAIDLGGIAKGYIADCTAAFLREKGVTAAMVDLGGNIVVLGRLPQRKFNVGVRDPLSESGDLLVVLSAEDESVVTSGSYERSFMLDGTLYHHILNPATGMPVNNGLAGVTIVTENAMAADALSTTCFLLGAQKGLSLIESLENTEALFVTTEGETLYSSGMEAYIAE